MHDWLYPLLLAPPQVAIWSSLLLVPLLGWGMSRFARHVRSSESDTASSLLRWLPVPVMLVLLVCVAAFQFSAFPLSDSNNITLPIEVIGPDGYTETVTLNASDPASVEHLWVRAYSIGYPGFRGYDTDKASIRLNGGDWVDINNSVVTCQEPEASTQCVSGPMHTIRFRIPISALGSLQETNTLSFRFNYAKPGAVGDPSTGYRILGLELRDGSGTDRVEGTTFSWDDPGRWSAPQGARASEGETLWHERDLLIDGWNGPAIRASCADCHTKSGYDLQYFAFSNESIVQRARFHGLSRSQGEDIAAYIRSISLTTEGGQSYDPPGRPWNPPYQPGPTAAGTRSDGGPRTNGQSFSDAPSTYWAAGAGAEWALDEDRITKDFLFPNGITPSADPITGKINTREIPVGVQMPDWNEWLPIVHPMDAYGSNFTNHYVWNYYENEVPGIRSGGNIKKVRRAVKELWKGLEEGSPDYNEFRGQSVQDGAPYEWGDAQLSRMQWALVKSFELMHVDQWEDDAQSLYGPGAEPLQWLSDARTLFDLAPHIQGRAVKGNDPFLFNWYSTVWYQLQVVMNPGSGIGTRIKPQDWRYHYMFLDNTGTENTWRHTLSYLKALQVAETIPEDRYSEEPQGWHLRHMSPIFIDRQHTWSSALRSMNDDDYRRVLNVAGRMLVEGMTVEPLSNWERRTDRIGIEPESHVPQNISGGIGNNVTYADHFWTALQNWGEYGVSHDEVLRPLADWAASAWPQGDWSGRVAPYKDNPPIDQPSASVSFRQPSDGATFTDPSAIALEASAALPDEEVETVTFFANGTAIATDADPAYTASWEEVPTGTHTLRAEAEGSNGTTATDEISITVEKDASSPPPADDPDSTDANVDWAYYEGAWTELPDYDSLTPVDEGTSEALTLTPAQRDNEFGLRFTSHLKVPAEGEYTFYLNSDDGSRLVIDGTPVVDNDGTHEPRERSGTVTLSAGTHPVTVDYFEADGGEQLSLEWESNQFGRAPVDGDDLQRSASVPGETIEYTLDLQPGWNLVALPITPTDPSMEAVLGDAQDAIVVVKNEVGDVYSPQHGVTTLTRWTPREAYQVYATESRSLSVTGQRLDSDAPLELAPGWNYIPFLPAQPLPVEDAFSSLDDALVVVKDQSGDAYITGGPVQVNEIGEMQPGAGYRVYVDAGQTLTFPTAPSSSTTTAGQTSSPPTGVANDATLILEAPSLEDGTVVSAHVEDTVVGDASVSDGSAVLSIPGATSLVPSDRPHAEPGDRITLRAARGDAPTPIEPVAVTNLLENSESPSSSVQFAPNAVFVVEGSTESNGASLGANRPNPARDKTALTYTLPEPSDVRIEIYNMLGQRVKTVVEATKQPGTHEVTVNTSTLSSGVYFYRLQAGSQRETRKMTVVQ